MANPKGNPKIKEYGFKTKRKEPLKFKLSTRVTESMFKELKTKEDWNEFIREAIAKALREDRDNQHQQTKSFESASSVEPARN